MNKDDKKDYTINNMKVRIIFIVLFISNIVLYSILFTHYFGADDFIVSFSSIKNFVTMVSAIIILGYISTRLPQFRQLGDSSLYEISYFIIIGILSLVVSYFNKTTNTENIIDPYLEMFKILAVMLIFLIIATKTKHFKNILKGKVTRKDQFFCIIIFSILGCLASKAHIYVHGAPANVRCLIIMIAGLFGGPYVGIPSAVISAIFRLGMGGPTAVPCSTATIIAGIIGSVIYVLNGNKILRAAHSIFLMFLFTGFEMLLIIMMTPASISFRFVEDIYILMVFASVIGMSLFIMIVREQKSDSKKKISYEELRLNEFENTLDEYADRIDQLEEEIEDLKNGDLD